MSGSRDGAAVASDDGHYLIVDDAKYLGRRLERLRQHTPVITSDILAKSVFDASGVENRWITEALTSRQMKETVVEATNFAEAYVDALDASNGELFASLLGQPGVRFFASSMKYMFVRFVISVALFSRGLQAIVARTGLHRLSYVHDGGNGVIWPSLTGNVFFFPDNIVWRILQHGPVGKTVALDRILVRPGTLAFRTEHLRRMLRPIRDAVRNRPRTQQKVSKEKETIVLLEPHCDLSPVLASHRLADRFNIVTWQIDGAPMPNVNPLDGGLLPGRDADIGRGAPDFLDEMVLDVRVPEWSLDFEFGSFAAPLVREFVRTKWAHILSYWHGMRALVNVVSLKALLWANSPHRYPAGVAVEFCRLAGIPTVGMAHGGLYGSNDVGRSHFISDYEQCDYFFTYGFEQGDVPVSGSARMPKFIPIGSTTTVPAVKSRKRRKKQHVAVLYPPAVIAEHFFTKSEVSLPLLELFRFQKRILNLLKQYDDAKVLLKFLPRSYVRHPLRPYLERRRFGNVTVVDDISFKECLDRYDARVILIDEQSTPLNQAIVGSNAHIIVYNGPLFVPLTQTARELLAMRAVVCDTQDEFLQAAKDVLEGRVDVWWGKDNGFAQKYCSYDGDPVARLEEAIIRVVDAGVPEGSRRHGVS